MDPITGIRITTDGQLNLVTLTPDKTTGNVLPAMYAALDCSIVEPVDLWEGFSLWADEEGLLKARPEINGLATMIASTVHGRRMLIVGTIMLLGDNKKTGDILSLDFPALLNHFQHPTLSLWHSSIEHAARGALNATA